MLVKFEGHRKLLEKLVDAVKELEENGRSLIIIVVLVSMSMAYLELVSK